MPFAYALTYAPRQQPVPVDRWPGTDTPARPALHAPPGARETFRRVVGAWGNEDLIENAFDLREYDPDDDARRSARCAIRFHEVPHFVADVRGRADLDERRRALHLRRRLPRRTTSSSSSPRGTDLLMIEATLPRPERDGRRAATSRPAEAGEHGAPRAAPGGSCSPTSPTSSTSDWARGRGRAAPSAAPVEVAREGAVYDGLTRGSRRVAW